MIRTALISFVLLSLPVQALAAEEQGSPPAPAGEIILQKWAIETDPVYAVIPGVHAFTLNGVRVLYGTPGGLRGDLVFGAYARPRVAHNVVETIDEYLVNLGYRQYFWRGLHAELMLQGGYAWGWKNKIDGKDYANPALLGSVHAGYRLAFLEDKAVGFYVTPQVGYLQGLYTNIGPRETPDRFFSAKLNLGVSF